MPEVELRKKLTVLEEISTRAGRSGQFSAPDRGARSDPESLRRQICPDIAGFMDDLKPLGLDMARSLVAALGGDVRIVEGYGKGAIVGSAGELEHGALWHVPGGYAMREILGGAKAIVPSTKKVGGRGRGWMCPSRTSTPRTCGATSMRWRLGWPTLPVLTSYCSLWS